MAPAPLAFMVRRGELELLKPAGSTPREVKRLSDLDDQEGFRFYISLIYFYRASPRADDPVRVTRRGLAAALMHYYPMAGRLREMPGGKLVVDCTGEGVCFVEADADVALDEFGDAVRPPVPCAGEFLFLPVSQSAVVVNRPLLYVQGSAFVFGPEEIFVLREQLPPPMRSRMWRCRIMALGYEPGDEVRFMFLMNARGHEKLPKGFYGNALTFGVARTTAGELCSGTLGGGLVADALELRGRPRFTTARTYLVTDLTKLKMHEVDLGWGMPVYGGPASQTMATFHIPAISGRISVAMCLPPDTMDRFKANVRAGLAVQSPKM
ncbi:unnamed protein product [Alopecurus aequalis]